jgi:very-short-patch-repair endonuclease
MKPKRTDYPFMDMLIEKDRGRVKNGEVNQYDVLTFKCEKHGEYQSYPKQVLRRSQPCKKCETAKNMFEACKPIWKDILPEYQEKILNAEITNLTKKVEFECSKHGKYMQRLEFKLAGRKCRKCADEDNIRGYSFLDQLREDYRQLVLDKKIKALDYAVFICNVHGEYKRRISDHELKGCRCPKCSRLSRSAVNKTPFPLDKVTDCQEENKTKRAMSKEGKQARRRKDYPFIDNVRGDYQYKIRNGEVNQKDKVPFMCEIHGEHWQELSQRLRSDNCPRCSMGKLGVTYRRTSYSFENELRSDYLVKLKNQELTIRDEVVFICSDCEKEYKNTLDNRNSSRTGKCHDCLPRALPKDYDFIHEIRHDFQEKVRNKEINSETPIPFICNIHGEYLQTLYKHSLGRGCRKCGWEKVGKKLRNTYYPFMDKIHPTYREKINNAEISTKEKILFLCDTGEHKAYWLTVENYKRGTRCPRCNKKYRSQAENKIFDILQSKGVEVIQGKRFYGLSDQQRHYELDLYLPEYNIGIECNGIYWHSEKHKDRMYHYEKTKVFAEQGIQVIHLWEDDTRDRLDVCVNMILSKIGKLERKKVYARQCEVRKIDNTLKAELLEKWHIQGDCSYIGKFYALFYKDKPLSVFCINNGQLIRYASCPEHFVVGGYEKLEKHATIGLDKLISFADNQVSNGDMYYHYGWAKVGDIAPDYMYVYKGKREHKFGFRKKRFFKDEELEYHEDMTEKELAELNGLIRVYDSGKIKFEKKFNNQSTQRGGKGNG